MSNTLSTQPKNNPVWVTEAMKAVIGSPKPPQQQQQQPQLFRWPPPLPALDTTQKLQEYLDSLPQDTKYIRLDSRGIKSLAGIRFPPSLELLNLEKNNINILEGVIFPDGLRDLELPYNKITSLEFVKFPQGLESLILDDNKIKSLANTEFPPNLQYLVLDDNPIEYLGSSENGDEMIRPNKYVIEYLKQNYTNLYFRDMYKDQKESKIAVKSALKTIKQTHQATLKEISDFNQLSLQNQLRGITSFLRQGMEERAREHSEHLNQEGDEKRVPLIFVNVNGNKYPVPLTPEQTAKSVMDYMNEYYYISSLVPNCGVIDFYKTDKTLLEPIRLLTDYHVQSNDTLNAICRIMQITSGGSRMNKKEHKKWSMKYKRSINCRRPRGFSQRQHCKYGRRGWTAATTRRIKSRTARD